MKQDYESILCDVFVCNRQDLQLHITKNPSKERIIEAMQLAVKQGIQIYQEEEE